MLAAVRIVAASESVCASSQLGEWQQKLPGRFKDDPLPLILSAALLVLGPLFGMKLSTMVMIWIPYILLSSMLDLGMVGGFIAGAIMFYALVLNETK